MDVEGLPRRAGQQRAEPRLACRDRGLVHAFGGKRLPDLAGPEGIELVALARLLDRMAGVGRGIAKAPGVEGVGGQRVGRGGVVGPAAGADRVADDGIVHERPVAALDPLSCHVRSSLLRGMRALRRCGAGAVPR